MSDNSWLVIILIINWILWRADMLIGVHVWNGTVMVSHVTVNMLSVVCYWYWPCLCWRAFCNVPLLDVILTVVTGVHLSVGPIANLKGHYFQPNLSVCVSVCLWPALLPFNVNRFWRNLVTRTLLWSSLAATIMVQIGRRGTARCLFENFKKFSKITEFEFQNSGPSFFASVSPVYCKKIRLETLWPSFVKIG